MNPVKTDRSNRLGIAQFPMPPVSLEVRPDLRIVDVTAPVVVEEPGR